MNRYVRADLKRIHSYPKHWVWLFVVVAMIAAVAVYNCLNGNAAGFASVASTTMGMLPLILGVIIFMAIFGKDIHTRTMQVAIGSGISRRQVVLAKELEGIILAVIYYCFVAVLFIVLSIVFQMNLAISTLLMDVLQAVLETLFYMNVSMILIFATLQTNFAEILYVLFSFQVITGIFSVLFGYLASNFSFPDFSSFLYSGLEVKFFGDPASNWFCLIGMAIYLIVPLIISEIVFKKKELEF